MQPDTVPPKRVAALRKHCADWLRLRRVLWYRQAVAALLPPAELVHELVDSPTLARRGDAALRRGATAVMRNRVLQPHRSR